MRAAAVFLSFCLAATSVTGDGCLVKLSARTFDQEGRSRMRKVPGQTQGEKETDTERNLTESRRIQGSSRGWDRVSSSHEYFSSDNFLASPAYFSGDGKPSHRLK